MLEKMADFFEARLDMYDEHMKNDIEGAREFYPFTAQCLPTYDGETVLDLGCGTGLELEEYFRLNPTAEITGVDLSGGMLKALSEKFSDKNLTLIEGSYFDVPFDENKFDSAVSVESLHHFTKEQKIPLYKKLHKSLKADGYFILTDYFAPDNEYEEFYRNELIRLKKEQSITDGEFYHYDTPLTVQHETEALLEAGFASVEILRSWENTYTIKAIK